jgi:hypothetical protein
MNWAEDYLLGSSDYPSTPYPEDVAESWAGEADIDLDFWVKA